MKAGCCRKPVKKFADATGPSSIQISLPGTDPSDAERRRYTHSFFYFILFLFRTFMEASYYFHRFIVMLLVFTFGFITDKKH